MALIDTLMMAYTVEMVSVERVMSCIGRYTSDDTHGEGHLQELAYDTEDAIVTWLNKVGKGALLCTSSSTKATPTNILEPNEHTRLCFSVER